MPGRLAASLRPQPTPPLRLAWPACALAVALLATTGRAATAPAPTAPASSATSPTATSPAAKPPTGPASGAKNPTSTAKPSGADPASGATNPTSAAKPSGVDPASGATNPASAATPPTPASSPAPAASSPAPAASPTSASPARPIATDPAEPSTPGEADDDPPDPGPSAPSATGPRADVPRPAPGPLGEIPPSPPRDPNDAPFMQPPNNQPRPVKLRTSPDLRRGYSSVRRVALTLAPVFASFRLPFQGRCPTCGAGDPAPRQHGVGVGGELDVQIIRWLWLRAQGSYSVHPVGDVRVSDEAMNITVLAPAGTIRALGFGLGPVVALDLGRFIPLIEGGLGGLRVATPTGVQAGQMGQACQQNGVCDVGLRCGGDNTCHQGLIADLYFGGAVDLLVRRHISLGVQFRYHALLSAPGKFPVYLIGGLRFGVRF